MKLLFSFLSLDLELYDLNEEAIIARNETCFYNLGNMFIAPY